MLCTSIWKGKAREERCLFTHTHFYYLLTSKVTLLPLKRVTRVIRASFMTAFLKDKTPKSRDIAMNEWQIFTTMTEIIFDIVHVCTFCRVKRVFYFLAQEIIDYCCHGNWCYEIMRSFHIWKARAFSHKVWAMYLSLICGFPVSPKSTQKSDIMVLKYNKSLMQSI